MTAVQPTNSSQKITNFYRDLDIDPTASEQDIWAALASANKSIQAIAQISEERAHEKRAMIMDARRVLLDSRRRKEYNESLILAGEISREDLTPKEEVRSENRAQRVLVEDDEPKVLKSEVQEDNGIRFVVSEVDMSQKAQLERLLPLATLIQYQNNVQLAEDTQEAVRVTPRLPLLINPTREGTILRKYIMLPGVIEGIKLPELRLVEGNAEVSTPPVELKKAA